MDADEGAAQAFTQAGLQIQREFGPAMVRPMALGRLVRLSMKTTNTASDLASILDFHEDASGRFKGKL